MGDPSGRSSLELLVLRGIAQSWQAAPADGGDWETLLEAMAAKISDLMTNHPEKFYQSLYRLDVSEEKVSAILEGRLLSAKSTSKSRAIAELIVQRELQKARTRGDLP